MNDKNLPLKNREISWLSFNGRVLQEAEDPGNPLIEQLKFLGIFSSNLDEFYRIRVASLRRLNRIEKKNAVLGFNPEKVLEEIYSIVLSQQKKFSRIYDRILSELGNKRIFLINERQLNHTQGSFVKDYFRKEVLPTLTPIMLDKINQFPYLKDKSIYLAVRFFKKTLPGKYKHALVEIPTDVISRFLVLPEEDHTKYIILLDDVIRYCLQDLFYMFDADEYQSWTIKITRDAELDIDNDIEGSLIEKVSDSLKQRKKGIPVRFLYDGEIPSDFLQFLISRMKLDKQDLIPGARYHNFKDFINFPSLGQKDLIYQPLPAIPHPFLKSGKSVFKTIQENDCMIHLPYHSFDHVLQFLREASIDPKVKSIHITIYRLARNSNIVNALINAVKNGKTVVAVLELQARFDEEANINWAKKMEDEGVHVVYGKAGVKIHSKMCLVLREEKGRHTYYAHLSTGNYHEGTAKIYCDHSLFTADKKITHEVNKLFHFITQKKQLEHFKHLLVAPLNLRQHMASMIRKEIKNVKLGKEAFITLKLNHLVDERIIRLLYEAAQAGVKVNLIVRTTCSIIPDQHKNIRVISIVGRLLEHARLYIFCNGGKPKYYVTSADMMLRNLDHRIEIAFPVYDRKIQDELKELISIELNDNIKARIVNEAQDNQYVHNDLNVPVNSQIEIYNFLHKQ